MRRRCLSLGVGSLLLALAAGSAGAYHTPITCGTTIDANHTKKTMAGDVHVDIVEAKKFDTYFLKGVTHVIADSMGDVDISMCEIGKAGHVCQSDGPLVVPDECLGLKATASYRLDVRHCVEAACGEVDQPAPLVYMLAVEH